MYGERMAPSLPTMELTPTHRLRTGVGNSSPVKRYVVPKAAVAPNLPRRKKTVEMLVLVTMLETRQEKPPMRRERARVVRLPANLMPR